MAESVTRIQAGLAVGPLRHMKISTMLFVVFFFFDFCNGNLMVFGRASDLSVQY